jgi:hypothetical protein
MRNSVFSVSFLLFVLSSCLPFKTLNSTTYIKANDAFILGNNEHGKFYAKVTNTSMYEITIWQCPITGGQHSPIVLRSLSTEKITVGKNTSLKFENGSPEQVAIKLKVRGDVGLSMGYKN